MHACYLWHGALPHAAPVAGRGRLAFCQTQCHEGLRERNSRLQSDSLRDEHITRGRQPRSELKLRYSELRTQTERPIHWDLTTVPTPSPELPTVPMERPDPWAVEISETNSCPEPDCKENSQPVLLEDRMFEVQISLHLCTNDYCANNQ